MSLYIGTCTYKYFNLVIHPKTTDLTHRWSLCSPWRWSGARGGHQKALFVGPCDMRMRSIDHMQSPQVHSTWTWNPGRPCFWRRLSAWRLIWSGLVAHVQLLLFLQKYTFHFLNILVKYWIYILNSQHYICSLMYTWWPYMHYKYVFMLMLHLSQIIQQEIS